MLLEGEFAKIWYEERLRRAAEARLAKEAVCRAHLERLLGAVARLAAREGIPSSQVRGLLSSSLRRLAAGAR